MRTMRTRLRTRSSYVTVYLYRIAMLLGAVRTYKANVTTSIVIVILQVAYALSFVVRSLVK